MDLPATIQTLTSRDIRVLHLEPTDVCQAACPQCARETDREFDKNTRNHLSVDTLDTILPASFAGGLRKMFMCGNYGDPAAGDHTLQIYRWFRKLNPTIVLGMNTNGGLQNTFWWHELAQILSQPHDYVVFSIDGLEDTNGVYRVNVNWRRLMANAQSFIAAGGSAHWDMLVYRHNEHQVEACQQLARDMGFRWFRAKVSKRPLVGRLEQAVNWQKPRPTSGDIQCHALKERSVYIDAQGRISPCCWLGSRQSDFVTDFDAVQQSWQDQPNSVCKDSCSVSTEQSRFTQQWQREVELC